MAHILTPRRIARLAKRLGRLAVGRDVIYRYDLRLPKLRLGTMYGEWTLTPDALNESSVMYSFGVGKDISFDLAAIDRFQLQVHGFDPSPAVQDWIVRQPLHPAYTFHPFGIGTEDGDTNFFTPNCAGSMYSIDSNHSAVSSVQTRLPVHTLRTIIQTLGTHQIDILKLDVEGVEYSLIDQILSSPAPIHQLLIEFHHRIGVGSLRKTVDCVNKLRSAGFRLFHVSETSSEFSFVRAWK